MARRLLSRTRVFNTCAARTEDRRRQGQELALSSAFARLARRAASQTRPRTAGNPQGKQPPAVAPLPVAGFLSA